MLTKLSKRRSLVLAAVFVCGLLTYHIALQLGGRIIVDQTSLDQLEQQVQRLKGENNQLFEELFSQKPNYDPMADVGGLPYDGENDARAAVKEVRARARQEGKFLMVTFGANWCPDCRNLHRHLKSDVVERSRILAPACTTNIRAK